MDAFDSSNTYADVGPWTWQIAWAWQRAAGAQPAIFPVPPAPDLDDEWMETDLGPRIACWSALTHLLVYGLGWAHPARGLDAWLTSGQPSEDPILAAINNHWDAPSPTPGDDIAGFTAHLYGNAHLAGRLSHHLSNLPGANPTRDLPPRRSQNEILGPDQRRRRAWDLQSDTFHLSDHTLTPIARNWGAEPYAAAPALVTGPVPGPTGDPHRVLILDPYAGWYGALHRLSIPPDGARTSVDVIVRPVGWLGTYRRSTLTGRWFRGKRSVHALGN